MAMGGLRKVAVVAASVDVVDVVDVAVVLVVPVPVPVVNKQWCLHWKSGFGRLIGVFRMLLC
jgi:hypothetical protein